MADQQKETSSVDSKDGSSKLGFSLHLYVHDAISITSIFFLVLFMEKSMKGRNLYKKYERKEFMVSRYSMHFVLVVTSQGVLALM